MSIEHSANGLIADQLRGCATEREAALLLVQTPLALLERHHLDLVDTAETRNWRAAATYLDNVHVALHLTRRADPRIRGDLGCGRVALALQAAGVHLGHAVDGTQSVDGPLGEPPFLDINP